MYKQMKKDSIQLILTQLLFIVFLSFGLSSCGNDPLPPVKLVGMDQVQEYHSADTILLDAFHEGLPFEIKGGNGMYTIENSHENIVECRYDGKTLTFIPEGLGVATVLISDHLGNNLLIYVKVANHEEVFQIKSLLSDAYGAKMTMEEVARLKERIKEESTVQIGGRYIFTYRDKKQSEGGVTIFAKETDKPLSGIFKTEQKFSEEGKRYEEYLITLSSGIVHKLMLMEYILQEGATPIKVFREDVTSQYRLDYTELTKAELIQELIY